MFVMSTMEWSEWALVMFDNETYDTGLPHATFTSTLPSTSASTNSDNKDDNEETYKMLEPENQKTQKH